MSQETHNIKTEIEELVGLVLMQNPQFYRHLFDNDFFDYIENKEYGLAFEVFAFNANKYLNALDNSVISKSKSIIRRYIFDRPNKTGADKYYRDIQSFVEK